MRLLILYGNVYFKLVHSYSIWFIPSGNWYMVILYGYFIWFVRMVIANGILIYVKYN